MTEEYLDALSETGELIGPRTRSQCHREGLWHRVIHLWICNKYDYKHNTSWQANTREFRMEKFNEADNSSF